MKGKPEKIEVGHQVCVTGRGGYNVVSKRLGKRRGFNPPKWIIEMAPTSIKDKGSYLTFKSVSDLYADQRCPLTFIRVLPDKAVGEASKQVLDTKIKINQNKEARKDSFRTIDVFCTIAVNQSATKTDEFS